MSFMEAGQNKWTTFSGNGKNLTLGTLQLLDVWLHKKKHTLFDLFKETHIFTHFYFERELITSSNFV